MKTNPMQQAVELEKYIRSLNVPFASTVGPAERQKILRLAKGVPALEKFADIFLEKTDSNPSLWSHLLGQDKWGKTYDGYREMFRNDIILLNLLDKTDPTPSKEITADTVVESWSQDSTFTERLTTLLLLPKSERGKVLPELFRTLEKFDSLKEDELMRRMVKDWVLDPNKSRYQPLIAEDKKDVFRNILLGAASNPKFPLEVLKDWMYRGNFTTQLEPVYEALAPKLAENFSEHISPKKRTELSGVYGDGMVSSDLIDSTYLELRKMLNGPAAKNAFDQKLLELEKITLNDIPTR